MAPTRPPVAAAPKTNTAEPTTVTGGIFPRPYVNMNQATGTQPPIAKSFATGIGNRSRRVRETINTVKNIAANGKTTNATMMKIGT